MSTAKILKSASNQIITSIKSPVYFVFFFICYKNVIKFIKFNVESWELNKMSESQIQNRIINAKNYYITFILFIYLFIRSHDLYIKLVSWNYETSFEKQIIYLLFTRNWQKLKFWSYLRKSFFNRFVRLSGLLLELKSRKLQFRRLGWLCLHFATENASKSINRLNQLRWEKKKSRTRNILMKDNRGRDRLCKCKSSCKILDFNFFLSLLIVKFFFFVQYVSPSKWMFYKIKILVFFFSQM